MLWTRFLKHDPADPNTLNDGFVISLAETPDGTLRVGTLNAPGKLNRYNPASETFTEVTADSVDLSRARKSVYQPPALDEPSGKQEAGVQAEPGRRLGSPCQESDDTPFHGGRQAAEQHA